MAVHLVPHYSVDRYVSRITGTREAKAALVLDLRPNLDMDSSFTLLLLLHSIIYPTPQGRRLQEQPSH
jgi:hypothetical protein